MTPDSFFDLLSEVFTENGLDSHISREASDKFYNLASFLTEQNALFNLTSVTDTRGIVSRHFADSLLVSRFIPSGSSVVDIGAGAGFPSLPLAIVRPDLRILAVDATEKKVGFIRAAASLLSLNNISALPGRAEELGAKDIFRGRYDVSVARAVARLPVLAEWCVPLVRKGGLFISMKAGDADNELASASNAVSVLGCRLSEDVSYILKEKTPAGYNECGRRAFVFTKVLDTPPVYPRRNAAIQKSPL